MDALASLFDRYRRHGDLQALGQVFDALAPRLLAVALHVCGNAADAEDVLQQTFLLAMEREVAFDATRRLEPWLAGLLHNVARNARRHAARRSAEPLPELAHGDAGPIAAAEREELLARLRTHVDALPPEQRQVLRLQLQHGLSPADIAVALEVPPGTVRMRIHRGIEALRKLLPAGLAVGAGAVFAGRGLAAVKAAVLHAGRLQAAAAGVTAVAVVGGMLAMKKVALVIGIAFAVLVSVWAWWSGEPAVPSPSASPGAGAAPVAAAAHDALAVPAATEVAAERAAIAAPTGSLRVRVTARAKDGVPVPVGGTWLAVWPGESPLAPFDEELHRVITDGTGEVRFAALAPGTWHVQLVADQDFEPQRVAIAAGAETLLRIERTAAAVARGIVVNADGAPVAGADVWIFRGTYMARYSMTEREELAVRRAAVTDGHGRFAIPLQRNEARIGASRAGHGESFAAYASDDVRLVLGRVFATVSGSVRNANGAPVANAFVRFTPAGQDQRRAADGTLLAPRVDRLARTDAGGRFVFEGVAPGRVRVWATAWPLIFAVKELDVAPFANAEIALQMQDGVSVIGTVRYADGTPARVALHSTPSLEHNGHYCHCDSREDGSYELFYQPRQRFFVVVGRQQRIASREFANPEPGVLRCDFVLDGAPPATVAAPLRNTTVHGRLVDQRGTPIADKEVVLRLQGHGDRGERITTTASDGTFRFRELEADEFVLVVDRGTAAMRELAEFEAEAAHQRDLGDVVLAPPAALRVHVVRADGSPWRGPMPYVRLADEKGARIDRVNEPAPGGVRLRVWPGTFTAIVSGTDLIAAPQQVELTADAEIEVRVPVAIGRSRSLVCNGDGAHKPDRGDVLHATVRTADGAIVVRQEVTDLYPDLRGFRYWVLDHTFAFGRYDVEARSDSGQRYRGAFEVRDDLDDPTRVDVPRVVQ